MNSSRPSLLLPALLLLLWATVAITGEGNAFASAFHPSPVITRAAYNRRPRSKHHRQPSPPSSVLTTRTDTTAAVPVTTTTSLVSFFGLGPAELILIGIAGVIVIGPSKLLEFSKEAGSMAGKSAASMGDEWSEVKKIPDEFQKGLEEGEIEARSRKAKEMKEVD